MDRPCSDDHLVVISKDLTDWETVAYVLGLTQAEVEDVGGPQDQAPTTLPLKRIKMLMKWKNKFQELATYQRIATAFSFLERNDMAERVREVSATPSSPSPFALKLKTWYAYNNPKPDIWPPPSSGKFCKLNIVKIQNIESTEVRLNHISEAKKRVPVALENILDEDEDSKPEAKRKKVILIEGAPGSGKSRLLWHMCQKWESGELYKEFTLVIYIKLSDYNTAQPLGSVADILPCSSDMKESAWNEIKATNGNGVLFLLDGWDELPQRLQSNSIFKHIIESSPKHSLLLSTVVVTSRYMPSDEILHLSTSRMQIQGFTDLEVKECIMDITSSNEEVTQALMKELESRPSLLSSCHLPLNATIISYVYQVKKDNLPSTMLGIFKLLVLNCIQRHVMNKEPDKEHKITSLASLPDELNTTFCSLCELAFNGLMEDRVIFSKDELCSIPDHLSLLHGSKLHEETGPEIKYSFFHHTMQELLAALHMSRMTSDHQLYYFWKTYGQPRFDTMVQFYAGLTSLQISTIKYILSSCSSVHQSSEISCSFLSIFAWHPHFRELLRQITTATLGSKEAEICKSICENSDNCIKQELRSNEEILEKAMQHKMSSRNERTYQDDAFDILKALVGETRPSFCVGKEILLLANCLYEANNPALYEVANGLPLVMLNVPLSPSDCLSLGCLATKSCITKLSLFECNLSPSCIKSLIQGLHPPHCMEQLIFSSITVEQSLEIISRIDNIKSLCLGLCNIGCQGLACILQSLKGRSIQKLGLIAASIEINESNGSILQEFISCTPSLESLDLLGNIDISDIGANHIGRALEFNNTLKDLGLSYCGITIDGAVALCNSLEMNTGLNDLNLSFNDIGDKGKYRFKSLMDKKKTLTVNCLTYDDLGPKSPKKRKT